MNISKLGKQELFFGCIMILSYSILFLFSKETVIFLTKEDGLFEWIGALCLLASSVIFLLLGINSKKSIATIYYIGFCLVMLFGFGEEINWGQRIFNWETLDFLKETGTGQLNIHNIPGLERNAEGERRLLPFVRIISICWLIYLFVIPMMNKYSVKIHELVHKFKLPISPIWMGVFYIINHILKWISLSYFPGNQFNPTEINVQYITEIYEFNLEILLLLFSLSIYKANINRK